MIETTDVVPAAQVLDTPGAMESCRPGTAEELAETVREAVAARRAVVPWGGGTEQGLGAPPGRCDVLLETTGLAGILAYAPEDLTLSVRAGTTLAEIADTLAPHKQFLPLDLPGSDRATVGGIVATAPSSLRRLRYGGVRDMVIGLQVALADGALCKTGGRVVKNVAGYDLCKLFTGSLGTLGVITAVNLKVQPLPSRLALVRGGFGDRGAALAAASSLAGLGLGHAALVVSQEGMPEAALSVLCEGFSGTVQRQVATAAEAIGAHGGAATTELGTEEATSALQHLCAWRDSRVRGGGALLRGSIAPARLGAALDAVIGALGSLCRVDGLQADAGVGLLYLRLAGPVPAGAVPAARDAVSSLQGHLVLAGGTPALRRSVDPWGAPAAGRELARALKSELDPAGLLNPGRFAYGI